MSILSAGERTALQRMLTLTFNTTITIQAQVRTPTSRGGYTLSWAAVLTNVSARRTDLTGNEQIIAAQVQNTQMKRFHLAIPTVALDTSMRLLDTGDSNKVYNIRDTSTPGPEPLMTVLLCEWIPVSQGA